MPIPLIPTIYKYAPAEDYLRDVLSGKSLKFSSPLHFNDPFECRCQTFLELGEAGDKFLKDGCKKLGISPAERIKVLQRMRIWRGKIVPPSVFSAMDDLLKGIGVCCFSDARDSTLMWAHYAADHSGVCIGFDTSKHFFQTAWEVSYQDALPVISRPSDDNDTMLRKSLLTKSSHWLYEREWRIVKRTMTPEEKLQISLKYEGLSAEQADVMLNQDGPGLYSFPKQAITEVVLGVKMPDRKKLETIKWVREAGLAVPIYCAQRHPSEFRLEFVDARR